VLSEPLSVLKAWPRLPNTVRLQFRERRQRGEEAGFDAGLEAGPDVPPLADDEHRR